MTLADLIIVTHDTARDLEQAGDTHNGSFLRQIAEMLADRQRRIGSRHCE